MARAVAITRADGSSTEVAFGAGNLRIPAAGGSSYRLIDTEQADRINPAQVRRVGDDLVIDLLDSDDELVIEQWFFVCDVDYRGCTVELETLGGARGATLSPVNDGVAQAGGLLWSSDSLAAAPGAGTPGTGQDVQTAAVTSTGVAVTSSTAGGFSDDAGSWKPILAGAAGLLAIGAAAAGGSGGSDAGGTPTAVGNDPAPSPAPTPVSQPGTPSIISALSDAPAPTAADGRPDPGFQIAPGALADGARTNDDSPTLSGRIDVPLNTGQSVQVLRDGVVVGQAVVNGTEWTFTDQGLGEGRYTWTAQIVDASGSASATGNGFSLAVDAIAPAQPTVDAVTGDGRISPDEIAAGFVVSGSAQAGTTITLRWGELSVSAQADASGRFELPIAPGAAAGVADATIDVIATDSFGNRSAPTSAPVVVAGAQSVTITGLVDDQPRLVGQFGDGVITNDSSPTLIGTLGQPLAAGESVQVFRNGTLIGQASVEGQNWQFNDGRLADGGYTVTVRVVDTSGAVVVGVDDDLSFVIDTRAPSRPSIDTVAGNNRVSGDEADDGIAVTGAAQAGTAIEVRWGNQTLSTTTDADGDWAVRFGQVPVANGSSVITVVAVDAAGNQSTSATRTVTVNLPEDDDALSQSSGGSPGMLFADDLLALQPETIAGLDEPAVASIHVPPPVNPDTPLDNGSLAAFTPTVFDEAARLNTL